MEFALEAQVMFQACCTLDWIVSLLISLVGRFDLLDEPSPISGDTVAAVSVLRSLTIWSDPVNHIGLWLGRSKHKWMPDFTEDIPSRHGSKSIERWLD